MDTYFSDLLPTFTVNDPKQSILVDQKTGINSQGLAGD